MKMWIVTWLMLGLTGAAHAEISCILNPKTSHTQSEVIVKDHFPADNTPFFFTPTLKRALLQSAFIHFIWDCDKTKGCKLDYVQLAKISRMTNRALIGELGDQVTITRLQVKKREVFLVNNAFDKSRKPVAIAVTVAGLHVDQIMATIVGDSVTYCNSEFQISPQ